MLFLWYGYIRVVLAVYTVHHVWMYHDGMMDMGTEIIFNQTRRILAESYQVHLLTDASLLQIAPDITLPHNYQSLIPQHKSDVVRLNILERMGGWYLDTTTLVTDSHILQRWMEVINRSHAEFFGLCYNQCPHKLIESSLLFSRQNGSFVGAWATEMRHAIEDGERQYIYETYRSGVTIPYQLFRPYPYAKPYLVVYAAEQMARERKIPRTTMVQTENAKLSIYKLLNDCRYESGCVVQAMQKNLLYHLYPITKIYGAYRKKLWPGSTVYDAENYRSQERFKSGINVSVLLTMTLYIQVTLQFLMLYGIAKTLFSRTQSMGCALHHQLKGSLERFQQ